MRRLAVLAAGIAALAVTAAAEAKLTTVEEKWAKPMVTVWNQQNLALHVVLQAATAKNALVYGTPNNKKLSVVLNTFVVCGPSIRKAGAAPSPRLQPFATALGSACTHDTAGAHDFAKTVGAVSKNKPAQAQTLLKQGVAEFRLGTAALTKAYRSLTAIGGKNVFTA
jgi:hypothetical protein